LEEVHRELAPVISSKFLLIEVSTSLSFRSDRISVPRDRLSRFPGGSALCVPPLIAFRERQPTSLYARTYGPFFSFLSLSPLSRHALPPTSHGAVVGLAPEDLGTSSATAAYSSILDCPRSSSCGGSLGACSFPPAFESRSRLLGEQKLPGHPASSLLSSKLQDMASSLLTAARRGETEEVRRAVAAGDNVEAKDVGGWTPLHHASFRGHWGVVRVLLNAGADVSSKSRDGRTPLHRAALGGRVYVARELLDAGADLSARDNKGWRPLSWAAEQVHATMASMLLEERADVDATDEAGRTALHHAARRGREGTVRILLDAGADVALKDGDGWTALHHACCGTEGVARMLVGAGADASARAHGDWTPLHSAADNGHAGVVGVLLNSGAGVSSVDHFGNTALFYAARRGRSQVAGVLLDAVNPKP